MSIVHRFGQPFEQGSVSDEQPVHISPLPDGKGLLHCLLLALVPEPQVPTLQFHDVHSPQLPLTKKKYIYIRNSTSPIKI